ncbi:MAG TPA: penicillin-binding transpeptidase domain-containing protein [Anaerovoracaceae bacterium]|nr:penicillin-binding transpeptidase domain-containing protein [Anaerovoracaceae bacterium]
MAGVNVKNKRRIAIVFLIFMALLLALCFKVAWIQVVKADEYTEEAINQQTSDIPIEAKRGEILDRNGKPLATSAACYSLWVRPSQLAEDNKEAEIAACAQSLARILDMKADKVKERLTKEQSLVKVKGYLDKETADKVRALEMSGLEISEDTKRYYPLGNFASQLLGSVTIDNTGRTGVELQYDQYLSGIAGRWVKNTDINGDTLSYGVEKYYEAQDGLSVVLTIDEVIQHYVESAVETAMKNTQANRIMCIVMEPKTGDVLAMCTSPGFDPNNATEPSSASELKRFNKLSSKKQTEYLSQMWRNPLVSDTYEPGSTFKLITTSASLESGVTSLKESFNCSGKINIAGTLLHCWNTRGHGTQTLTQAVGNSCNPVQVILSKRMGIDTYYNYLDLFGITDKTGVDYPGESSAQILSKENVGPVELATMAYGQGIAVTPIQLLTAVCAIGNDGVIMQPRVAAELRDSSGKTVETFDSKVVRRVISSETAEEMSDIMEYVVSKGGGGAAKITGYRVGGKTGTADKVINGAYSNDTYSSFIGMAPMDDPQIAVLVVVDSPKGIHFGSLTAAPAAKTILENSLRYLEVEPRYTASERKELNSKYVTVPDVTGENFSDAIGILAGKGLKYKIAPDTSSTADFEIVDQYPKAGNKISKGGTVYIYKK